MKRYNAFTIQITDYYSDFWAWLDPSQNEYAHNCPTLGEDIFWFEKVPKELFQWVEHFTWRSGTAYLWCDNKPVTRSNYRTNIGGEEPVYSYLRWEEMTDIQPVIKQ